MSVSLPTKFKTPYVDGFIKACKKHGIPENDDYNGVTQNGVGVAQSTIKDGKRHSSASAFLKPVLNRPNLKAITHAKVCKIILKGKEATGLEYLKGSNKFQVNVEKEIIVSAGAFQSPQILMLSGIGDFSELKKHGIDCLHELKGVGKNLQDHLFYPICAKSKTQEGINHYISPLNQLKAAWNYFVNKKGVFCVGPLEGMAFFDLTRSGEKVNFQLHFSPICIDDKYGYDAYDLYDFPKKDGFTILPTLLHPKSRGTVSLASSNPKDAPIIQPNFLQEKDDLDQLVSGGKLVFKLMNDEALKKHKLKDGLPINRDSEDFLIDHIKKTLETVYHPVGTCKMGIDNMAVVDPLLKVHGISKLRVVDASIMPKIVSGNTNAPVYMIAEKAAEMILNN